MSGFDGMPTETKTGIFHVNCGGEILCRKVFVREGPAVFGGSPRGRDEDYYFCGECGSVIDKSFVEERIKVKKR